MQTRQETRRWVIQHILDVFCQVDTSICREIARYLHRHSLCIFCDCEFILVARFSSHSSVFCSASSRPSLSIHQFNAVVCLLSSPVSLMARASAGPRAFFFMLHCAACVMVI